MNDQNKKIISLVAALVVGFGAFFLVGKMFTKGSSSTAGKPSSTASGLAKRNLKQCESVPPKSSIPLDKTETFGSHDDAYSLKYTLGAKWNIQDTGDYVVFYNLDKTADDKVSVAVSMFSGAGNVGLDKYIDGVMSTRVAGKVNSKILEECITKINGVDAYKIVWTGDDGLFPNVKATNYVLEKNGKLFYLDYTATQHLYDKFAGTAEEIMASLDVK